MCVCFPCPQCNLMHTKLTSITLPSVGFLYSQCKFLCTRCSYNACINYQPVWGLLILTPIIIWTLVGSITSNLIIQVTRSWSCNKYSIHFLKFYFRISSYSVFYVTKCPIVYVCLYMYVCMYMYLRICCHLIVSFPAMMQLFQHCFNMEYMSYPTNANSLLVSSTSS